MGNSYEIYVWTKNERTGEFEDKAVWAGEVYGDAIEKLNEYMAQGFGCVKLECRVN